MIYLTISPDGDIQYGTTSRNSPLQVEQSENFFAEYPSPCWTYTDGEFKLKEDADSVRSDLFSIAVAAPERPAVSPVEFKLLFTSAERIKLAELRPTDPILDDFWGLVDDPRTTTVRLSLSSTQQGVGYVIEQLVIAGIIAEADAATRMEQILSGEMQ